MSTVYMFLKTEGGTGKKTSSRYPALPRATSASEGGLPGHVYYISNYYLHKPEQIHWHLSRMNR